MNEYGMMALSNLLYILTPVLLFAVLMFFIQHRICRLERSIFSKLVPGVVTAILTGICIWQIWLWNGNDHTLNFVMSFLAGLCSGGLLLGCLLAWIIFAVKNLYKKI